MNRCFPYRRSLAIAALSSVLWAGYATSCAAQGDPAPAANPPPAEVRIKPSRANDPVVQALLESKPSTPKELLSAIDTLMELGAIAEADTLMKQLASQQLDEGALTCLAQQFGSGMFLKLALAPDLQPEGKQFADAVLAAAVRQARDPERLAALIEKLKSPDRAVRRSAIVRLQLGGDDALRALMAALADERQAAARPGVHEALVAFGSEALGPLLAVARSAEPKLQAEAIAVLGELGRSEAALYLLGPALLPDNAAEVRDAARLSLQMLLGRIPGSDEAATALERQARAYYEGQPRLHADPEGRAIVWRWDAQKSELSSELVSTAVVSLSIAAKLAGDASALAPHRRAAQLLYLGALIEEAAYRAGLGAPLPEGPDTAYDVLSGQSPAMLESLLAESLEHEHPAAAAAAARLLGKVGRPELLYLGSPQPSALVQAARHPDRRLRMAAIEAIFRLKPSKPYPGSSFVVDAVGYLAAAYGEPRALAADARPLEVELTAGLLATIGYEVEAATTDRDAVATVIESPDYELALIDFSLAAPTSGQLIERFRRDNRTSRLPIGIIASSEDLDRAERLSRRFPLTAVIIRAQTADALQYQTDLMMQKFGRVTFSAEERRAQARQALDWLAEMSQAPRGLYNLRRVESSLAAALSDPELGPKAAPTLAKLGTATSQRTLVDLASFATQPIGLRQAAAEAFAASVADFGPLLTTSEIRQQYDRYNNSETLDQDTQQVLASILDVVEARAVADSAE